MKASSLTVSASRAKAPISARMPSADLPLACACSIRRMSSAVLGGRAGSALGAGPLAGSGGGAASLMARKGAASASGEVPIASRAPTKEPADVPKMKSACERSTPAGPPPLSTKARVAIAVSPSDLLVAAGPVGRAHLPPLHLAGFGAGDVVDEVDAARHLVAGEVGPNEVEQLIGQLRRGRVAGVEGDNRLHLLAPLVVGHADRAGLAHGRMAHELVVDLLRVDVHPAGDDALGRAADRK